MMIDMSILTFVSIFLLATLIGCRAGTEPWTGETVGSKNRNEWVDGEVGRLRVTDGGTGKLPVLFIHSLGGIHSQWIAQLRRFRSDRRAVAFDLRGHGDSDGGPEGRYGLTAMAEDIECVAQELNLTPMILVGHSFGAGVATVYAGAHPDRVRGLVLVDPIGEQRRAEEEIRGFISALRADYEATITEYWKSILVGSAEGIEATVLSDLRKASRNAVIRSFEATLGFEPRSEFNRYRGPALVIRTPTNDFPYSIHNVVEGLRDEVVERTSHWLQMDRPSEFNRLLGDFIRQVENGSRDWSAV